MAPIEVSRPATKTTYHKTPRSGIVKGKDMGNQSLSSASERLYGILKVSDPAVIDEIAELDQFDQA